MIGDMRVSRLRQSARQAFEAQRWDAAIQLFEDVWRGPHRRPSDGVRLAAAYEASGQPEKAGEVHAAGWKAFPVEPNVRRQAALFHLRRGDPAAARVDFAKALVLSPERDLLEADLAELGDDAATARLRALAAFASGPAPEPSVAAGWRRYRANRLARRSKAMRARGEWEAAVRVQRGVLALNPRNAGAHIRLGHALKESGRVQEAESAYWRGVALAPRSSDSYVQLGHILKMLYGLEEAVPAYLVAREFGAGDHHVDADLAGRALLGEVGAGLGATLVQGEVEAYLEWRAGWDQLDAPGEPDAEVEDDAPVDLARGDRFAKFDIPWPPTPGRPLPKSRFVDVRAAAIAGDLGLQLGVRL